MARLLRQGPTSVAALVRQLGVSTASVYRMLREMEAEVVSAGQTRRRRHALVRQLRGTVSKLPVYAIDEAGGISEVSTLELVHPQGCMAPLDPAVWPQSREADGWWEGLPYPIYDMRPQGFLGRLVARAVERQLHVPDNPDLWSDDDVLVYLMQYGRDQSGNLVVGEQAMQTWSRERTRGLADVIPAGQVGPEYVKLAEAALGHGVAGSSVGGEFPKFTAARELEGALTPHVIVKFSGSDDSPAVRRWSDLLVCEHLALQALQDVGGDVSVARSRVLQHGGRTFLESERFDRHGSFGRSPVVTLSSVEGALIGSGETQWPRVLRSHGARRLFTQDLIHVAEELYWFGHFIANTDMHTGNLSLRPRGSVFGIAPTYDMLPMLYAPLRAGEVPARNFDPTGLPVPAAGREEDWSRMLRAALAFWQAAAADPRITNDFRQVCADNGQALQRWSEMWVRSEDQAEPHVARPRGQTTARRREARRHAPAQLDHGSARRGAGPTGIL